MRAAANTEFPAASGLSGRLHSPPSSPSFRGRVELRLQPEDKAPLTRAASIKRLDLTGYILSAALPKAEADIPRPNGSRFRSAIRCAFSRCSKTRRRQMIVSSAPQGPASPCHDGARLGRSADRPASRSRRVRLQQFRSQSLSAKIRASEPRNPAARNVSSPRRPTCQRASSASTS